MASGIRYATKVTLIAAGAVLVPAALLDLLNYGMWVNEGTNGTTDGRGPFALAFLPMSLWFAPIVITVAVLVTFFSGEVEGSER